MAPPTVCQNFEIHQKMDDEGKKKQSVREATRNQLATLEKTQANKPQTTGIQIKEWQAEKNICNSKDLACIGN